MMLNIFFFMCLLAIRMLSLEKCPDSLLILKLDFLFDIEYVILGTGHL